jgi:pilus assembly protein CpaC
MSSRGYARTLAEPTLVSLSGKTASFLAGGEFPIPMPQGLGQIGVEFRKFGIQLEFTPTVMGDNIQLKLAMTVSDVNPAIGVKMEGASVPGLTERHSQTTVRMRDGQSFVIAGLLSDRVRSTLDKVPGFGDLPILGSLFRSSSYQREETELLVVVTAHRVRALSEKPNLPGEHTVSDPSDLELFLLGKYESIDDGHKRPQKPTSSSRKQPVGAVGFSR